MLTSGKRESAERHAGFPFRVEKGTVRVEGAFGPRFFPDECLHATPNTATIKHMHQIWMPRLERIHQELMLELASASILERATTVESARATAPWFVDYTQEVRAAAAHRLLRNKASCAW